MGLLLAGVLALVVGGAYLNMLTNEKAAFGSAPAGDMSLKFPGIGSFVAGVLLLLISVMHFMTKRMRTDALLTLVVVGCAIVLFVSAYYIQTFLNQNPGFVGQLDSIIQSMERFPQNATIVQMLKAQRIVFANGMGLTISSGVIALLSVGARHLLK